MAGIFELIKKTIILLVVVALINGCARGSYVREHPYKTTLIGLAIIATAGLIVAAAAKSSGGGSTYSSPQQSTYVSGYNRANGTYVRPHYRTYPDDFVDNNYGLPSQQQAEQFKNYATLPTYLYDFDGDNIANQYDMDDDNDGVIDSFDKAPYNPLYR